jgi:uncharacterized membrane protein
MSDQQLVVLGFDTQIAAGEFVTAAARMSQEGKLLLQDAVFVTKNDKGKVRVTQTTEPSVGQSALGGAFWGLLFGALLFIPVAGMAIGAATSALIAKFTDTGVSDDFIKKLRESIEPGRTNVALLVSHIKGDEVLEELTRFSGMATLVYGSMPPETIAATEAALAEHGVDESIVEDA